MAHAFELRPLIVAALIGAFALWAWGYVFEKDQTPGAHRRDLIAGAGLGAVVQVGVRLAGVS